MTITVNMIESYRQNLVNEEKSQATVEKYLRDVRAFFQWTSGCRIDKSMVLAYKAHLTEKYAPASVNSALSSLNSFFEFCEHRELEVKMLRIQKHIFADKSKELTKEEYSKLLRVAKHKKNKRLYYLMQTICSSGIRVSELRYITVEAVRLHQATIRCKGKMRVVILPGELCSMLRQYADNNGITEGAIFVTRSGKPLDRHSIWKMMKALCSVAGVAAGKGFPHNLRHLFARTYYTIQKDIVRLADILGHSSINTTRIYTMETGDIHRRQIQQLGLLRI